MKLYCEAKTLCLVSALVIRPVVYLYLECFIVSLGRKQRRGCEMLENCVRTCVLLALMIVCRRCCCCICSATKLRTKTSKRFKSKLQSIIKSLRIDQVIHWKNQMMHLLAQSSICWLVCTYLMIPLIVLSLVRSSHFILIRFFNLSVLPAACDL